MRYFILDDDLPFCLQLQEMLEDAAAEEVSFAHEVRQALASIHEATRADRLPDVILCDYTLGNDTTGFDFLQALQDEGFDIPAVLLTDFDEPEAIEKAEQEFSAVHVAKTGLETAELVQQISMFALRRWAEQRRLANAQIRRQANNMFLLGAEIAHEFKDVLHGARLLFDRVKRMSERGALAPAMLNRLSAQLDKTLDDGLQLSRLLMNYNGVHGHVLSLEDTDPAVEIAEVSAQPEFSQLKIKVNVELANGVAAIDRFVLRRALSVLLRNIVDHADGGFDVDITVGETSREGVRSICIDVEDNGPGIDPEHRRKIFEAGERAGKDIQYTGLGGLGLGLGFARALVGLHTTDSSRGTIQCLERTIGTGARFRISLPQE